MSISLKFPNFGIRNISIYYLLGIFLNGWFVLPNWVFYFSQYIDRMELGIVEGVAILVGVLMEIPSGALADLFGKKRTIIIGSSFQLISCLMLIMANQFAHFLLGNVLMFIGFAFQSGAMEAFAYDSLKEKSQENHYDVVASKYTAIAVIATVISTAIGGYLYSFKASYPFYAWVIVLIISIVILMFSTEPAVDSYKFSFKNYLKQLKEGGVGLFGKNLRVYLIPILSISILIKLYQGIVRQSMAASFSFTGETFGYLLAAILIPGAVVSYNFDRIKRFFSDKTMILMTLSLYGLAFGISIFTKNVLLGSLVFLIIMVTERVAEPLVSVLVNQRIDSKHRATILSTKALIAQIPYVILVLAFAQWTLPENLPVLFLLYFILMAVSWFYSMFFVTNKAITRNRYGLKV